MNLKPSPNGGHTCCVQIPVGDITKGAGEMERCVVCLLMGEFCGTLGVDNICESCTTEIESSEADDQDVIELTIIRNVSYGGWHGQESSMV